MFAGTLFYIKIYLINILDLYYCLISHCSCFMEGLIGTMWLTQGADGKTDYSYMNFQVQHLTLLLLVNDGRIWRWLQNHRGQCNCWLLLTILFAVAIFGCGNYLPWESSSVSCGGKWPYWLYTLQPLMTEGVTAGNRAQLAGQDTTLRRNTALETNRCQSEDKGWRWFTVVLIRNMTQRAKKHNRHKQERCEAAD